MLLTLLVQTLLLPGAPLPTQYLEVQRNWRLDEQGAPLLSTERTKAFAVEVESGLRRKRNLENGSISEEALPVTAGFLDLARTHQLCLVVDADSIRLLATPQDAHSRRHEFVLSAGGQLRHTSELRQDEKSLRSGTRITTRSEGGRLVEIEVDFYTLVAGAPYRGLQKIRFETPSRS